MNTSLKTTRTIYLKSLMTVTKGIRTAITIAGKLDRKYNINKIFVDKYVPPGYRKITRQVFDVAGALGGGLGIYNYIQGLYAPDTPGNDATIPFRKLPPTSKSYQARGRSTIRYRSKCSPDYQYGTRKRYTRFSKRY